MRRVSVVFVALLAVAAIEPPGCQDPSDPCASCVADSASPKGVITAKKGDWTGRYIVVSTAAAADNFLAAPPGAVSDVSVAGGLTFTTIGGLGLDAASLDDVLERALKDPNVLYVQQETRKSIQGHQVIDDALAPTAPTPWGRDRVDQRALPLDGTFKPAGDGTGADVCVIDTGVDLEHPAIVARLDIAYSVVGGNGDDGHGHGTHVSATATSERYGLASGARLLSCQALRADGSGTDSSAIACVQWCADQHVARTRPMVLNMSLGGPPAQALDDALRSVVRAGVVAVVAAGNESSNACSGSPARLECAWTIGASEKSDTMASFSNWGPGVDLFAPGADILSARRGDLEDDDPVAFSGTSMAAPHVAGSAAICLGLGRDLEACLRKRATAGVLSGLRTGSPNLLLYVGGEI